MTDWVSTMTLWNWAGMALTVGLYCVFTYRLGRV